MAKNPFTLMFGVDAESIIYRVQEFDRIVQSFSEQDSMYSFLITGIRGSGKTVLLRAIENHFREDEEWAVININPQGSMMQSLANRLFDTAKASKIIGRKRIKRFGRRTPFGVCRFDTCKEKSFYFFCGKSARLRWLAKCFAVTVC